MWRGDLAERAAEEGLRHLSRHRRQRIRLPLALPRHTGQEVPVSCLQGVRVCVCVCDRTDEPYMANC